MKQESLNFVHTTPSDILEQPSIRDNTIFITESIQVCCIVENTFHQGLRGCTRAVNMFRMCESPSIRILLFGNAFRIAS